MRAGETRRRLDVGDALFAVFLVAYAAISAAALPYDFRDLCYLFSLEQGRWVMQEWVHPIYVPTLDLLQRVLALFGYRGPMVVPVEVLSIAAALLTYTLLYRLARRFPGSSIAAVVAVAITALTPGFWDATVRPTPYSLTILFQTLSLSLLIAERPVPAHRYALSGALAGIAMGYHASAMALAVVGALSALLETDHSQQRAATRARVLGFGAGMFGVVVACWVLFVFYRDISAAFFRHSDFWSTFAAIEQVPGTSIYTSQSPITQLTSFAHTILWQTGWLPALALLAAGVIALRRWGAAAPLPPLERRLLVVATANFAAIAGFFLINNTHNGLIFASLTLAPVLIVAAMRNSRLLLVALCVLAGPATVRDVTRIAETKPNTDPLLHEVRFLHGLMGPSDVMLTPGNPFPEVLYLAHRNIFEVSEGASTHGSPEVPVLRPGAALRARIAHWRERGGRVFYAFGDVTTDFGGDPSGAEKERQIFWRPELAARERAPVLAALRAALEASGVELRDEVSSPEGHRYAEVHLRESSQALAAPPPAAPPATDLAALADLYSADDDPVAAYSAQRARYIAALAAALPDDRWIACDIAQLVCQKPPLRDGAQLPCDPPRECDELSDGGTAMRGTSSCFWRPHTDRDAVAEYLSRWVRSAGLGELSDWGFHASGSTARMTLATAAGALVLRWNLSGSCAPEAVDAQGSDAALSQTLSAQQLRDLAAGVPVKTVRASAGPNDG